MTEKITEMQLTKLQMLVNQVNQTQMELGQVEARKFDIIAALPGMKRELSDFQKELESEYGKVSININDGTIKQTDNEADTED